MVLSPFIPVAGSRSLLFLATAAFVLVTLPASAEGPKLDSVAGDYAKSHDFHGTILVECQEVTLFRKSFGLADREFEVPVRDDTKFKIASITKAFTSVLILQLRDEGKLDVEATFKTYLPGYPGVGADRITIRQLLNHTSGLANHEAGLTYEEADKEGIELYQLPHTPDRILEKLASGKIAHEPGKVFDYNNHDYVILGKVIETLSGKSYEDTLRERILNVLGMSHTGMMHQHKITKQLARTYWLPKGSREFRNDLPMYPENWYAAGGMYSTADDLKAFADALYGNKLLKPDSLALMMKPGLDDYGFGVWISGRNVGGKPDRVVERFGSIQGANCILAHAMNANITVIILSNTNATDLGDFSSRLMSAAAIPPRD